jgi:hypothetical protein
VPVTINSTRDKGPSFRLRRLGLPPTRYVEIKLKLVRPFEGIISGNSTGRGDLAFCPVGWPADHPIPDEVEVLESWIAGPAVRRSYIGRNGWKETIVTPVYGEEGPIAGKEVMQIVRAPVSDRLHCLCRDCAESAESYMTTRQLRQKALAGTYHPTGPLCLRCLANRLTPQQPFSE